MRWTCLSISSAKLSISSYGTKFKINSRNLGSTLCGLASACHQLPAMAFWWKDSKHQRENPRPMGVFCWAWLEREAKAPTSLKTPHMQSIGQSMLALWNFNIIYPHPDMKFFFLRAVSAGFQAGELGEIHLGSAERL